MLYLHLFFMFFISSAYAQNGGSKIGDISNIPLSSLSIDKGEWDQAETEMGAENHRIYFLRDGNKTLDDRLNELIKAGYRVSREKVASAQVKRADAVKGVPLEKEDFQERELTDVIKIKIEGKIEKVSKGIFGAKWSVRPVWEMFYKEMPAKTKSSQPFYEYVYGKGYVEEKPPLFGDWEPTDKKLRVPGGLIGGRWK